MFLDQHLSLWKSIIPFICRHLGDFCGECWKRLSYVSSSLKFSFHNSLSLSVYPSTHLLLFQTWAIDLCGEGNDGVGLRLWLLSPQKTDLNIHLSLSLMGPGPKLCATKATAPVCRIDELQMMADDSWPCDCMQSYVLKNEARDLKEPIF